ncbi:MAG TPA: oxygenase MpaB family protein [Microbacteriaceae bacterium]|nr:oxygenase MpaB family protein [Microbacteriaceae bacterium]
MATNSPMQERLAVRFRRFLSGAPDGTPPWLSVVAEGDEPGLYLPSDAPWVIHGDFGTLVGGIRALLMQALHPGALAGVAQHSRYESDPLGRLSGTIRWLTVTTFGSHTAVANEARRVNRMHERVTGQFETGAGTSRDYRAADPDLLLWVHVAFMESFLRAHENYSSVPIPAGTAPTGADNYVRQWGASVAPLGLDGVPTSVAELTAVLDGFRDRGELVVSQRTRDVVAFIRKPPLPRAARGIYALLFQAAVASLRPDFREMLGLRTAPRWLVQPSTRTLLRVMRWAIGPESPIEDAAIARLERIGALEASAR